MGGIIAYNGDLIGRRFGKRRVSLFGLRPKYTAILITSITGVMISALTTAALFLVATPVREVILNGERALRDNELLARQKRTLELSVKEERQLASAAQLRREQAEEEVRRAQRLVEAKQTDLKRVQNLLDRAETDLRSALRAKEAAERQLRALSAQNRRLSENNRTLVAKNETLMDNNQALEDLNTKLADENKKLIADNRIIARQNSDMSAENEKIARQNEELIRDNTALAQAQRSNIEFNKRLVEEKITLISDNENLTKKNQSLSEQNQMLAGRVRDAFGLNRSLMEMFEAMRMRRVVIHGGEDLARWVIPANSPPSVVRQALEDLMEKAHQTAISKGAGLGNGRRAVQVIDKQFLTQVSGVNVAVQVTQDDRIRALVNRLSWSPSPVCLLALAIANTVEEEPALIDFQPFTNRLIYQKGQVIATRRLDARQGEQLLFEEMVDLLKDLGHGAIQRGMIPRIDPTTGEPQVGSLGAVELVRLVDRVRSVGNSVKVTVIARADTQSADPLNLDFKIEPAR
jgi:uncharacterized protein (DUF3084 family)